MRQTGGTGSAKSKTRMSYGAKATKGGPNPNRLSPAAAKAKVQQSSSSSRRNPSVTSPSGIRIGGGNSNSLAGPRSKKR